MNRKFLEKEDLYKKKWCPGHEEPLDNGCKKCSPDYESKPINNYNCPIRDLYFRLKRTIVIELYENRKINISQKTIEKITTNFIFNNGAEKLIKTTEKEIVNLIKESIREHIKERENLETYLNLRAQDKTTNITLGII